MNYKTKDSVGQKVKVKNKQNYKIVVDPLHGEDKFVVEAANGVHMCVCYSRLIAKRIVNLLNYGRID